MILMKFSVTSSVVVQRVPLLHMYTYMYVHQYTSYMYHIHNETYLHATYPLDPVED